MAAPVSITGEFVDAILARDLSRARGLLHPEIDFRAMTPKRVWEGDDPAGVEDVLRALFEHPERDVERVQSTGPVSVEDTMGWDDVEDLEGEDLDVELDEEDIQPDEDDEDF